jgi:bacterioferritin-associated ferredoxin
MYVCVCNGIKESDVRALARRHPSESIEQLYARLDVEVDCGSCLSFAEDLAGEERCANISRPPRNPTPGISATA